MTGMMLCAYEERGMVWYKVCIWEQVPGACTPVVSTLEVTDRLNLSNEKKKQIVHRKLVNPKKYIQ